MTHASRSNGNGSANERILYIDPWTGVSGDMLLGALLDTDRENDRLSYILQRAVASFGLGDALLNIERSVEKGVSCTRITVLGEKTPPLRHLPDMEKILAGSALSALVRERSLKALRRLAEVEASVHGCAVEDIHFHEVGAVDTLVDVVGTFVLVEALGVDHVMVAPIPVGGGTVEIAHGRMGVPAPATARLLQGFPVLGGPEPRELTTPTGALLVGQLDAQPGPLPPMTVESIGNGAGSMTLETGPNVLRVLVGDLLSSASASASDAGVGGRSADSVVELQTNLDDVTPEIVGHACTQLRQAGALEVWTEPVFAKKDRPACVLHALVAADEEATIVDHIFRETGTLGVRRSTVSRWVAQRGILQVQVAGSEVAVKWGRWDGSFISVAPEYEDAVRAASACGRPLQEVMHAAHEAALALLQQDHPAVRLPSVERARL